MARSAVGRLTINLAAVQENFVKLKNKVHGNCIVAAVVKADAYGLGTKQIVKTLHAQGCTDYFVSTPQEGILLRQCLSEKESIYILNGYYSKHENAYTEHSLTPVIGSFKEIKAYNALCKTAKRKLSAAINFNTGMNRLGFDKQSTQKLLDNLDTLGQIDIKVIMSHFASADDKNSQLTVQQYNRFVDISAHFPNAKKSIANSYGIFANDKYHLDMVRPGMALYGLNPMPNNKNPMTPSVTLTVPIVRTRRVKKDEITGYNEAYKFDTDTTIATVSAGYADGIMRSLSNKGVLYWKGYPCPIRGKISMDLTTVDLCNIPREERPKAGNFLEVLGENQTADKLGKDANTIGYELITSLGKRYRRKYTKD